MRTSAVCSYLSQLAFSSLHSSSLAGAIVATRRAILTEEDRTQLQERRKAAEAETMPQPVVERTIADSPLQLNRAVSLIDIIGRRLTAIEGIINSNLRIVGMSEHLGIEPEVLKATRNRPTRIEPIEQQLIEDAFAIDRGQTWPAFYEMGKAIKDFNQDIDKNNEQPNLTLSHDLLRQIAEIRRIIVVIQSEQATHGESEELKIMRQKLKNFLAKRETLATAQDSPGFDMGEARRRNERFIAEVRAAIKQLENEQL